jgi:uridine kinase
VEGILVLTNKELLKEFDLKVFVHADSDERLIRRIRRDTQERGRDLQEVLHRYQTTLKPMHQEFIEPSKNEADLIVPNMKQNSVAIDFLTTVINNSLKKFINKIFIMKELIKDIKKNRRHLSFSKLMFSISMF